MPAAIVAGLPRDHVKRVKHAAYAIPFRAGWEVHFVPAPRGHPEVRPSEVTKTRELASELGGAHILLISKQDHRDLQKTRSQIQPFFRFVALQTSLLGAFPHMVGQFVEALNEYLIVEEEWARQIQPTAVSSALIVPGSCFSCGAAFSRIWTDAFEYGRSEKIAYMRSLKERMDQLHEYHWRRTAAGYRCWTDDRSLVFDHKGQLHGAAQFPWDWKFSFNVPPGFHFDVQRVDRRAFTFRDCSGATYARSRSTHINVDMHGQVR